MLFLIMAAGWKTMLCCLASRGQAGDRGVLKHSSPAPEYWGKEQSINGVAHAGRALGNTVLSLLESAKLLL